jgi:hypothetical protein
MHLSDDNTAGYAGNFFMDPFLWVRDMTQEISGPNYLQQGRQLGVESGPTDQPNYLLGSTILCYDCHAGNPGDNLPDDTSFAPYLPQDIAFGGDGLDGDDRGTPVDSGGIVGYYELPDGTEPTSINAPPTLSEVQSGTGKPGGHYIKSMMADANEDDNYPVYDPAGRLLYEISIGDKLPCSLCHDPHRGETSGVSGIDEIYFRRNIYAGGGNPGIIANRSGDTYFTNKMEASDKSRWGHGNGRKMCIYCHGTADWDGVFPNPTIGVSPLVVDNQGPTDQLTIYGIQIRSASNTTYASSAFPPPIGPPEHESSDTTTPCTNCHLHNNVEAECGGCHEFPPTTGAHLAHASTAGGKPEFNCETCHGPNPGTASWHNDSNDSSYSSTDSVNYNNITLMPSLSGAEQGVEASYYNSTWTRSSIASAYAPTVTSRGPSWQFECTNVVCHGMDTINWTWKSDPGTTLSNPAPSDQYLLCGGCHGLTSNINNTGSNPDSDRDGDGKIDVASFYSRGGGTLYEATSAAANYEIPVSGFSRGGHGDSTINSESPAINSAPNSSPPVACAACHDPDKPHFNIGSSNRYRLPDNALNNTLPGWVSVEGPVTNLCTQTDCHPKLYGAGNYAVLEGGKHASDHFAYQGSEKAIFVNDGSKPIILSGLPSDTTDPHYNPDGLSIGVHIDQYVDHWAWWEPTKPATSDTGDDYPFLPLGDSLELSGSTYDNQADSTTLITCITCHNPHGTDLVVGGETPGQASTFIMVPDNNMLRLRYQEGDDDELCEACH